EHARAKPKAAVPECRYPSTNGRTLNNAFMTREPRHLLEVAVEPKTRADADRLNAALESMQRDQPKFGLRVDPESGQTILAGSSEEELEAVLGQLIDQHHIEMNVGAPQVVYREGLLRPARVTYAHKRQIGGAGEFAEVTL